MPRSARSEQSKLDTAKRRLDRLVKHATWVRGIGIGLVHGRPGVLLSVAKEGEAAANELVRKANLDAPVRIRVVGPITKRGASGRA